MRDFRRVEIKSRIEWRAWLHDNCDQAESIWLVTGHVSPIGCR